LDAAVFEHRFIRDTMPDWVKVTVNERHFLLSSQQMYASKLAPAYFHSFDECQANLRNYSAWQAQGDIKRSGQTFVHAVAVDQYTDNSPAVGPELVTLQCVDTMLQPQTPTPAPLFTEAAKIAETPLSQSQLPLSEGHAAPASSSSHNAEAHAKALTYLDPQESPYAKEFDENYNVSNLLEPRSVILVLVTYDLETRKFFKGGPTTYHFDDFSSCRGNISNFLTYMTPYMKTVPHGPTRLAIYGEKVPGMQYVGRDPQSQKILLIIPGCVQRTSDGSVVEDPSQTYPQPAFDAAQKFVSSGFVK